MKKKAIAVVGAAFICHLLVSAAFGRTVPTITITPENQADYGFSVTINKGEILHRQQEIFFFHVECPAETNNWVFHNMGVTVSDKSHVIATVDVSTSTTDNLVRGGFAVAEDHIPFATLGISYDPHPSTQPPPGPYPVYTVDLRAYFAKFNKDHNHSVEPTRAPEGARGSP